MRANLFRVSPMGRQVLACYGSANWRARLFLNARWRWTPYEHIARHVPERGLILDLGSGHGLLALTLGLGHPERTVVGIDHEASRVALARQAAIACDHIRFSRGNLLHAVADSALEGNVAAIVILDAIHYLTVQEQVGLLADARKALRSDGVLLIRDVDAAAGKTFFINRLYERTMTGLGITRADRLHFRSRSEWHALLEDSGFACQSQPCTRFPFADFLFVCRLAQVGMAGTPRSSSTAASPAFAV